MCELGVWFVACIDSIEGWGRCVAKSSEVAPFPAYYSFLDVRWSLKCVCCILTLSQVLVTAWEQRIPCAECSPDLAFSHRQTYWLWVPILPNKVYLVISPETTLCFPQGTTFYQRTNSYIKMWELNIVLLYSWQSRKFRASGTLLSKCKEMELAVRIGRAFPSPLNPLCQRKLSNSSCAMKQEWISQLFGTVR